MEAIIFNGFCQAKNCPEFIKWDFGMGDCFSCRMVGQSYNVDEYPANCIHIEEIKLYEQGKHLELNKDADNG